MAGRSDFNSILPRKFKRLIALMSDIDENQKRVVRKLFIDAHASCRVAKKKMLTQRGPVDAPEGKSSEQPTAAA